jgi:hypothetical protein
VITTTLPNRRAISQIVREYRILVGNSDAEATLRAFASALTEALQPVGRRISYQTIKNWEDCRHLPDGFAMMRLSQVAHLDWRGSFAKDILAARFPETYKPATEIGRRAIASHKDAAVLNGHNGHKRY